MTFAILIRETKLILFHLNSLKTKDETILQRSKNFDKES